MLAKVPTKRSDGKTSFKSLAKYVNERDHIDPVSGEVSQRECANETNCLDKDTAWHEMKAVADMNGRVKDPVYHYVVSWPGNEKPTDVQAFEAGRAGMKAVGMEGHQYLFAVHRDTDNVHVHCMVNRVNPETYRAVYPDRDYFKLDKTMREIELRQGWSHDNGPTAVKERNGEKVVEWAKDEPLHRYKDREKTPGKARQMEVMTGNESLTSYAQGQPKKDAVESLKNGGGWQALHDALDRHGLEIKPKGQGFAIYSRNDPQQTPIKASTMAQELGGGKLTKQLGEYQERAPESQREKAQREYSDQRPKRDVSIRDEKRDERATERQDLRNRYKAFSDEWKASRAPDRASMYDGQKQRQRGVTEQHKARREEIRKSGLPAVEKRALYSVAAFETATKRADLADAIKGEREQFKQQRAQGFRDWVGDQADDADPAAMRQVRGWAYADKRKATGLARAEAVAERGPHVGATGSERHDPATPRRIGERVSWSVDRQTGNVDYKMQERTVFRDTGKMVSFTNDGARDGDAIEAGLRLAREKFAGQELLVNGSDEFKERVLQTAIERRLDVRFSDAEMEKRRDAGLRPPEKPDWSKFRELAGARQTEKPQERDGQLDGAKPPESAKPDWSKFRELAGMRKTEKPPERDRDIEEAIKNYGAYARQPSPSQLEQNEKAKSRTDDLWAQMQARQGKQQPQRPDAAADVKQDRTKEKKAMPSYFPETPEDRDQRKAEAPPLARLEQDAERSQQEQPAKNERSDELWRLMQQQQEQKERESKEQDRSGPDLDM